MLKLNWTELFPLDSSIIETMSLSAGVYRLSYKSSDGSYYVFYVGRSDTSTKERLLSHISENEDNICIKINIKNLDCYFRFAPVENESNRKNAERALYDHFKPKCNVSKPEGEPIEINYS